MKALTICQPHASYVLAPILPHGMERKAVENRQWRMSYRGPLLIHAGSNRDWLIGIAATQIPEWCPFGAILGVVDVVDCLDWHDQHPMATERWLRTHEHACGRFCIVMHNPRRFEKPIKYKGRQGLFDVPDEVVAEQLAKAVAV